MNYLPSNWRKEQDQIRQAEQDIIWMMITAPLFFALVVLYLLVF